MPNGDEEVIKEVVAAFGEGDFFSPIAAEEEVENLRDLAVLYKNPKTGEDEFVRPFYIQAPAASISAPLAPLARTEDPSGWVVQFRDKSVVAIEEMAGGGDGLIRLPGDLLGVFDVGTGDLISEAEDDREQEPGPQQTVSVAGTEAVMWFDGEAWHRLPASDMDAALPGGSIKELSTGVLGIFNGSGILIGSMDDPTYVSTLAKNQMLTDQITAIDNALRTAIMNQDATFEKAMDRRETLIKEAQFNLDKAISAVSEGTERGHLILSALKASIPAGTALNLPVPGAPGQTFQAPVHQISMDQLTGGVSPRDIMGVDFEGVPAPPEIPVPPTAAGVADDRMAAVMGLSAAPAGGVPVGVAPVGVAPVGGAPVGGVPVGAPEDVMGNMDLIMQSRLDPRHSPRRTDSLSRSVEDVTGNMDLIMQYR